MLFFFWILVTCSTGIEKASCGECSPKPISEDDSNCSGGGDCEVKEFTTAINPLDIDNSEQKDYFCTSKYLNHINN